MRIKNIKWLSKEALEAEVYIEDENLDFVCFSQPLTHPLGKDIKGHIHCYANSQVAINQNKEIGLNKLSEPFVYEINGILVNKTEALIQVNQIIFELDLKDAPGDLDEGDYVSFSCQRLDLY